MMTDEGTEARTVAGAMARIRSHEELCAERYRGINAKLNGMIGAIMAIFIGLLGWMAVQLYTLEPLRNQAAMTAALSSVAAAQSSTAAAQAATAANQARH